MLAIPTLFTWALAGALAPPAEPRATFDFAGGMRALAFVFAVIVGIGAVGRSALEWGAMFTAGSSTRVATLDRAVSLDPASYRIQLRDAQANLARGSCKNAVPHARAA